jgi:hypothetical protein
MPALGHERRFEHTSATSALPLKADIRLRRTNGATGHKQTPSGGGAKSAKGHFCREQVSKRRHRSFAIKLRGQLVQQRLRLPQVERIEAFGKPAIHRNEQFARFLDLPLGAPEAREAHGGAEFPRLGVLPTRNGERPHETSLGFPRVWFGRLQC